MLNRFFYFWAVFWGRDDCTKYALMRTEEEARRLRKAVAPLLKHAKADDKAPPLKFSVDACRKIKENVGFYAASDV